MRSLEEKIRQQVCPCQGSYYDIQYGYKICGTSTTDCKVYLFMKMIAESEGATEEAKQFVKNYKFVGISHR